MDKRFNEEGIEGLYDRAQDGRKKRVFFAKMYWKQSEKNPSNLGKRLLGNV